MNRKEAERLTRQRDMLVGLGFTVEEAESLRRISMTLRRWHERECNGEIKREKGKTYILKRRIMGGYTTAGREYAEIWEQIPDRETGARKRLANIMQKQGLEPRPNKVFPLETYIQTDQRGAALYILRPGDVPDGERADSYYTRGICVY